MEQLAPEHCVVHGLAGNWAKWGADSGIHHYGVVRREGKRAEALDGVWNDGAYEVK